MNTAFYYRILAITSLLGITAVCIGAFGSHYLKSRLDANDLEILRTGVFYMFVHILAIGFVATIGSTQFNSRLLKSAVVLFLAGVILFSGSLFAISTNSLTGLSTRFIGPVTPLGGLCFIGGWLMLFLYFVSGRSRHQS